MRRLAVILSIIAVVSGEACAHVVLDRLVSDGNRAYESSHRSRILECADSLWSLLPEPGAEERLDYEVAALKLYGNYEYVSDRLDKALEYYGRGCEIIGAHPDVDFHGNRVLLLRELAQLHYRRGDYAAALEVMDRVDDILEFEGIYEPGDDNWLVCRMSRALCMARLGRTDEAVRSGRTELDNALFRDGMAYSRACRMYAKILLLADADKKGALKAYKEYFAAEKKDLLARMLGMDVSARSDYWSALQPFVTDCMRLEDADAGFLYDVTLFAKGLLLEVNRGITPRDCTWADVRRRLNKNQAAVEFVQYEKDGRSRMAALVLRPGRVPRFVRLTDPDSVISRYGARISSTRLKGKDALYDSEGLQHMIWTPELLQALDGVRRVYFAPDGYLHRVAIEYMPQVSGLEMRRLTSTRRLLDKPAPLAANSPALFVGAINYDLDRTQPGKMDNDSVAYSLFSGFSFPRLSNDEAREIYLMRENGGDTLVRGADAGEGAFRRLAPRYSSILVSTHGEFRSQSPVATDMKPVAEDNTMSQSVIALSGVNGYLGAGRDGSGSAADGLLSARELSRLDLSACRLFTVAACQSGLGEITADGVFGLQRGIKNAGAGVIVVSLWSVSDRATYRLMRGFYSNLAAGMTVHGAFDKARLSLFAAPAGDGGVPEGRQSVFDAATMAAQVPPACAPGSARMLNTPQYTHAFIMIDAID